ILLVVSICLLVSLSAIASTVHGRVMDSVTHEELPGVSVYINELQKGDVSELDGDYKIKDIPKGEYTITLNFISYQSITAHIKITSDTESVRLNFFMVSESKA